jgi:TolB-like protein/Flp pilus assembly protein TadD
MTEASPTQATPTSEVFISYASQDKAVADAIVEALEKAGLKCWIAPRDVDAGALYADAIVRSISGAKAFVLVLSANAIVSSHVGKEIERASSKKRPILALRIDAAALTPGLEYFLSESQWIEAQAGNMEPAFAKLIAAIRKSAPAAPGVGPAVTRPTSTSSAAQAQSRRNRMLLAAGLAVVAITLAALYAPKVWLAKHPPTEQPTPTAAIADKSIAVLPFVDMSEKHDQEYFADGLSEELANVLGKIPDLRVIGHASSFQFKGKTDDLRGITTQLGVAHVVEGSVRRSGEHVRVTAQLIRVSDGVHEWSGTYDRTVDDLLQVQSEIAMSLARALQLSVATVQSAPGTSRPNAEAYDAYLRGLHAFDLYSRDGFEEASSLYQRATELDPQFVPAYEGLAGTHLLQALYGFVPAQPGFARVREEAEHLLKRDSESVYGHMLLCRYHITFSWDWSAAGRECAAALARDPHNWAVLYQAAELALVIGETEKSVRLFREILSIDPLNADTHLEMSAPLVRLGRFADAAEEARRGLAITPTYAYGHYYLGTALLADGKLEEARRAYQLEAPEGGQQSGLAIAYFALGQKRESAANLAAFVRDHGGDGPFMIAQTYAYLGEPDRAFEALERAYRQKDASLQYVKDDWLMRSLQRDPRYKAFLRKMNLPE